MCNQSDMQDLQVCKFWLPAREPFRIKWGQVTPRQAQSPPMAILTTLFIVMHMVGKNARPLLTHKKNPQKMCQKMAAQKLKKISTFFGQPKSKYKMWIL